MTVLAVIIDCNGVQLQNLAQFIGIRIFFEGNDL
jgi:hypothetical protein